MSRNANFARQSEAWETLGSGVESPSVPRLDSKPRVSDAPRREDEELLSLVQRVFWMQPQEPPRVVAFTSVDDGIGASSICAATARLLARNPRQRVCLVDANLRAPALSAILGGSPGRGLTDALTREGPIQSFTQLVAGANLSLLPAGTLDAEALHLLSRERLQERMLELRQTFDFVIIDTPPLQLYSDALVVSHLCDGVILVLASGNTGREPALAAVSSFRAASIPILAAVLNKHEEWIPPQIDKLL